MPFTFDLAAFGWHATIFVGWESLAVLAVLVIVGVAGARAVRHHAMNRN